MHYEYHHRIPFYALALLLAVHLHATLNFLSFIGFSRETTVKSSSEVLSTSLVAEGSRLENITFHNGSSNISFIDGSVEEEVTLCTREQIRNGQWSPVVLRRPPYISTTKHLRCYPVEYYMATPWKTWEWVPRDRTCQLTAWNSSDLCDLLRLATVSIIGDSLNWEMYSSLLQLLGQQVFQNSQHKSKTLKRNHIQMACNGNTKFVWRNDARLHNVADSIANDFPTVLVLNRGAHYENDTSLMSDMQTTIEEVRSWLNKCDKYGLKCHFFWRTTVPGHPGCANFSAPINDIAMMEELVSNLDSYDNRSIAYHWYDFQHQNELVLDALAKSMLNHQIIDAYELNVRRPDEHRAHQGDCLHNCYPGKMDVYNQLLLHYLKMQRSPQDVDHMVQLFEQYNGNQSQQNMSRK